MSRWTPCKRRDFIRRLKALGFDGPFAGTRHSFMIYLSHGLAIPSNAEYSVDQLRTLLAEVEALVGRVVTLEEWTRL